MARRNWSRALFAVVGVALVGTAATLALVKVLFPEERLRAMAIDAARTRLGRDVRLSAASVGLTGLSLSGLEISEKPDFGAGVFVSVDKFSLRPSWRALLHRRLVVSTVSADGLSVRIVRSAEGAWNYASLISTVSAAAGPSSPETTPAEFAVRRANISRAKATFVDVAAGTEWNVDDLDAAADGFSPAKPFGLTLSGRVRGKAGKTPVDARVNLDTAVDLAKGAPAGLRLEIHRLTIAQNGVTLAASGRIENAERPKIEFDADLSAAGLKPLRAVGSVQLGTSTDVRAKVTTPAVDTRSLATFFPGVLRLVLPAITLDLDASAAGDDLAIKSLTATSAYGSATAFGTVRGIGSARPMPDLAVSLNFSLPAFRGKDLPFLPDALPPALLVPAARLTGAVKLSGANVVLDGVTASVDSSTVRVDGVVGGALDGTPRPAISLAADIRFPALTDADIPFRGVPAGLKMPPSQWTAKIDVTSASWTIKSLRAKLPHTSLEASGSVLDPSGRGAIDILLKSREYSFEELAGLVPSLRPWKPVGGGLFAMAVAGTLAKPSFSGNLRFSRTAADFYGIPLADFNGTVSFDDRRIDAARVTGQLGDGSLAMDATVKDYSGNMDIALEVTIDRLDVARWLEAKAKWAAARTSSAAAQGKASPSTLLISSRGKLAIGEAIHPALTVRDLKAEWDLRGIGGDMKSLSGDAKLTVGGGHVKNIGDLALQSPLIKVFFFPLMVVQKIGRIGGVNLFPNFNDISLISVVGDYGFRDGLMGIRRSEMESDVASVSARGTIDVPAEALDLTLTAQVANVQPLDVAVTGTLDKPKTKVNLLKFLADPAKQLLKNLVR